VEPGTLPPTHLPADQLLWLKSPLNRFSTAHLLVYDFTALRPRREANQRLSFAVHLFISFSCLSFLLPPVHTFCTFASHDSFLRRIFLALHSRFVCLPGRFYSRVGVFGVISGLLLYSLFWRCLLSIIGFCYLHLHTWSCSLLPCRLS
jgi:hypothetical protein